MRDLHTLDRYRVTGEATRAIYGWDGDDRSGAFMVPSCIDRQPLCVIAANDEGWDHISVSRKTRVPNWYELEQIKRLFFEDNEVAVQFHLPPSQHISVHPNVLHLWRPHDVELPLPPGIFV